MKDAGDLLEQIRQNGIFSSSTNDVKINKPSPILYSLKFQHLNNEITVFFNTIKTSASTTVKTVTDIENAVTAAETKKDLEEQAQAAAKAQKGKEEEDKKQLSQQLANSVETEIHKEIKRLILSSPNPFDAVETEKFIQKAKGRIIEKVVSSILTSTIGKSFRQEKIVGSVEGVFKEKNEEIIKFIKDIPEEALKKYNDAKRIASEFTKALQHSHFSGDEYENMVNVIKKVLEDELFQKYGDTIIGEATAAAQLRRESTTHGAKRRHIEQENHGAQELSAPSLPQNLINLAANLSTPSGFAMFKKTNSKVIQDALLKILEDTVQKITTTQASAEPVNLIIAREAKKIADALSALSPQETQKLKGDLNDKTKDKIAVLAVLNTAITMGTAVLAKSATASAVSDDNAQEMQTKMFRSE